MTNLIDADALATWLEHEASVAASKNAVDAYDLILKQVRKAAVAAPAIQEAVAYRIASKLRVLSTERAQADDMKGSRDFSQAADVAVRVAKGGW